MLERELKLAPPETFSLARLGPQLNGYAASPVQFKRLHTVYYDTPDLRLTRWGCSLRLRLGEGWTLKIPVPSESQALFREEHVFPDDDTGVPAAVSDLATAYLRGASPAPVAELRTLRTSRRVTAEDGADLAEVVEDDVRVVDGTSVIRRFRQVEIELADGAPDELLDVLEDLLRCEGAGKVDPVPKNVRALGERAREPEIHAPQLTPNATIGDVARAAFARSAELIVRYDAKLRLQPDETTIHQARVAVRRLRILQSGNLRSLGTELAEQLESLHVAGGLDLPPHIGDATNDQALVPKQQVIHGAGELRVLLVVEMDEAEVDGEVVENGVQKSKPLLFCHVSEVVLELLE